MARQSAMNGAELRCTREFLGLTTDWLAAYLQVDKRRLERWESDKLLPIPNAIVGAIDDLYAEAEEMVRNMTTVYSQLVKQQDAEGIELLTYRTDRDLWSARGASVMPARWHRMICARVCERVPGLLLDYAA